MLKKISIFISILFLLFNISNTVKAETFTIVSDTNDITSSGKNAVVTWVNKSWVKISEASWIWNSYYTSSINAINGEVETFTKNFTLDTNINSAQIQFATDNGYRLEINNVLVEDNYLGSAFTYITTKDIKNFLKKGENTIKFTVRNSSSIHTDPKLNPGGLIYKISIEKDQSVLDDPVYDKNPRIMYWWGKVNQHIDSVGVWQTDPDGVSGANLDKLTYCKKWYPNTVSVEDYKNETIDTWRERGNVNAWNSTKMSTKCIQGVTLDPTPRIMYWWGKVNQHIDSEGVWQTDPDGVSGANLDKLTYCKKWYPNTVSVEDYKMETINTWRRAKNYEQSGYTSTQMSTKCIQGVTLDPTPRIMYWWGKVNQHIDSNGAWQTDSDGSSGANLDKLNYCKKFWPNTVSVEDYKNETIDTWRAAGNTGAYTSTKMSTKCVPGVILPPVNGGWSMWENSGSCINGKQTQIRSCNTPTPANGGSDCVGSAIQEISCTVIVPIDGGWSDWKNSGTCFSGIQSQMRTCTNPSPANGGAICVGDSIQNISCSTVIPINGGWSSWKNSGRCINGNQAQIRTCTNPIPKNGGSMCVGDSNRNVSCTLVSPVNGGWSSWENINSCINNKQKQIRLCNNPTPANGGDTCSGVSIQEIDCISTDPQEDIIDEDLNLINVSFYRDLILGRFGDDVKLLQKILKDKGYDIGRIDGIYGEKTQNAVTLYQKKNGLKETGFIDNDDILDRVRLELLNVD